MHLYGWIAFAVFVVVMLVLDLGVFHRKSHEVSFKEALIWSGVWIGLAMLFNVMIYFYEGSELALAFLTGYVIEKSLSVDNIFVFLMIFSYFKVPARYQHRVLFWGVLGAIVIRAIFIYAGISLIQNFKWMIYVFGAFLIYTGIKLLFHKEEEIDPEKNLFVRLLHKFLPVTSEYHQEKFTIRKDKRLMATPLLVVLILIESTDIIFAVDSIPAILAIVQDPFIVYTSNIFAILGLRALYFALAGMMDRFRYLRIGLSVVLSFVGIKMVISDFYHIPVLYSLLFILVALLVSIFYSLLTTEKVAKEEN